jgi:2'-hydroxyisoflavone reductase
VTLFHRGQTNPGLFPDAGRILGDRDDPPAALGERDWDWVFDVSCYTPQAAERLVRLVGPRTGRYVFCSTGSVYRRAAVDTPEDFERWPTTPENLDSSNYAVAYGARKAAAEDIVMGLAGEVGMEAAVVRPMLVYGPWDTSDRYLWWLHRVREGAVIVPDGPQGMLHQVYVKDLAHIFVAAAKAEHAAGRVYNGAATRQVPLMEWIETAAAVLGRKPAVRAVAPAALEEAGVKGLPCWTRGDAWTASTRRIQEDFGFTSTPFAQTIAECYAHMAAEPRVIQEAVEPDVLARLMGQTG